MINVNTKLLILSIFIFALINTLSKNVFSKDSKLIRIEEVHKSLKEKDFKKALSSLNEMSNKNNLHAQHLFSQIFYSGNIVPQDFEKAYFWSNAANLGGFKKAKFLVSRLDNILDSKQKLEIHEKIRVFLENLAMEKNKLAILQVAKWHLTLAEEVDYSNAYKWYNVAVAIGIKTAIKKRNEMIEELNSEEILKAQQLSNQIFNKINKNGG